MKSPCKYPGCRALLESSGYCPDHQSSAPNPHKNYDTHVRAKDPALAEAHRIRRTARWVRVRNLKLSDNPLCEDPFEDHARRNTTETAAQVHHIKGLITNPELAFHFDNLLSVCTGCHARLEAQVRKDARP